MPIQCKDQLFEHSISVQTVVPTGPWPMESTSYFDLDDILCEEQRVKVRFNVACVSSSLLLADEQTSFLVGQIEKGSIIDVPFWLADVLSGDGTVSILPARMFGPRVRSDIDANPITVSLKDLSKHYYLFGLKLAQKLPSGEICRLLKSAFRQRLEHIAQPLVNPSAIAAIASICDTVDSHRAIFHSSASVVSRLDSYEQRLYETGAKARRDMDDWFNRSNLQLRPV